MMHRALLAASALGALALTACNGGTTSTYTAPPACGSIGSAQLVYPAPGATGVSPAIAQVVVALGAPLQPANTYNLALLNTASGYVAYSSATFQVISASQLPPGSATTTISNPTYESVALSNSLYNYFSSGSTLQVALNINTPNCSAVSVPGGTFTLQ